MTVTRWMYIVVICAVTSLVLQLVRIPQNARAREKADILDDFCGHVRTTLEVESRILRAGRERDLIHSILIDVGTERTSGAGVDALRTCADVDWMGLEACRVVGDAACVGDVLARAAKSIP